FEPSTARWDDPRSIDILIGSFVRGALKVSTRRTDELGDDDAFGTVDDEGTFIGHQREVAHEYGLLLNFAGVVVHELGFYIQRCSVCGVPFLCFLSTHFRVREFWVSKRQGHGALIIFDW